MRFTKMQGAGNDYVLIETSDTRRNWSHLVGKISDRHFGIGADSLLVLLPSKKAQFKMRIFDPDGSEAEACGNGIRCLAKYVFEKGLVSNNAKYVTIETNAGVRKVKLYTKQGKLIRIQVNMGDPQLSAVDIPVIKEGTKLLDINSMLSYPVTVDSTNLNLNLISMGNPHAVHFSKDTVADFPLSQLGPLVEHLPVFPNRVNFEVARIINRRQIEARVWERGVGETLACGTGACAITVAAQKLGYVDNKVDIILGGGKLRVEWNGKNGVFLSGPAEIVFEGEWPFEVKK